MSKRLTFYVPLFFAAALNAQTNIYQITAGPGYAQSGYFKLADGTSQHLHEGSGFAGMRRVVDVFEVANDSNRVLVTGAAGMTWRVTLPREARDPGSAGGDLPRRSAYSAVNTLALN